MPFLWGNIFHPVRLHRIAHCFLARLLRIAQLLPIGFLRMAQLSGPRFNHSDCLRTGRQINKWYSRFDDTRLLRRDFFNCVAEYGRMVQPDGSDHSQIRCFHRIGQIQSAAKSCFDDAIFYPGFLKSTHGHQINKLKKGRMGNALSYLGIHQFLNFIKGFRKGFVTDLPVIYTYPFIDTDQMGRSKQPSLKPHLPQTGFHIGTDRALAVGPCHMDIVKTFFRASEKS